MPLLATLCRRSIYQVVLRVFRVGKWKGFRGVDVVEEG
jgi:hypothetical protein